VAEVFTGQKGRYVKLEDTIEAFDKLLKGEFDNRPEEDFYMKGGLEDLKQ
jgi:F-type H+-transporting ATPase subunit beta